MSPPVSPTIAECLEHARQCEWYAARSSDEADRKFLLWRARETGLRCKFQLRRGPGGALSQLGDVTSRVGMPNASRLPACRLLRAHLLPVGRVGYHLPSGELPRRRRVNVNRRTRWPSGDLQCFAWLGSRYVLRTQARP